MNIHTVNPLIERFERLVNTASALVEKIHQDCDQLRQRRVFYSFVLPATVFRGLEQDFGDLQATIQTLKIALENIQEATRRENA